MPAVFPTSKVNTKRGGAVRFTLSTKDGERQLFTVRETDHLGTLLLDCKLAPYLGYEGNKGPAFKHQKYSIHVSDESPDGNLITNRIRLADDERLDLYHWTRAIKSNNGFAHVYSRRFYNLLLAQPPKARSRDVIENLGSWDPFFTPLLGVFVGDSHRTFDPTTIPPHVIVVQRCFTRFSVVVMLTYLTVPPDATSDIAHVHTFRPEVAQLEDEQNLTTIEGGDEVSSIESFTFTANDLVDQFMLRQSDSIAKSGLAEWVFPTIWRGAEFMRTGVATGEEWQAFKLRLEKIRGEEIAKVRSAP